MLEQITQQLENVLYFVQSCTKQCVSDVGNEIYLLFRLSYQRPMHLRLLDRVFQYTNPLSTRILF